MAFTTLARRLLRCRRRAGWFRPRRMDDVMDLPPLPIDLVREPARPAAERRPQAVERAETAADRDGVEVQDERKDFAALLLAARDAQVQPAAIPAPGGEQAAPNFAAVKSAALQTQTAVNAPESASVSPGLQQPVTQAVGTQVAPPTDIAPAQLAEIAPAPPTHAAKAAAPQAEAGAAPNPSPAPAAPPAPVQRIATQSATPAEGAQAVSAPATPSIIATNLAANMAPTPQPKADVPAPPRAKPAPAAAKSAAPSERPVAPTQTAAPAAPPTPEASTPLLQAAASPAPPVIAETTSLRAGRDDAIRAKPAAGKANTVGATGTASPAQVAAGKAAAAPAPTLASAVEHLAPPPSPAPDAAQDSGAQPTPGATHVHATADSARAGAEPQAARILPAAAQLAQQIVRRAAGGATQFDLRLDPPELGRVNVQLELSRDHRVTAHIVAEDPATLTQLARAAREIEQTLQSAGLELADNGLSFDLAQSNDSGREPARAFGAPHNASTQNAEAEAAPARAVLERWRGARVDLVA